MQEKDNGETINKILSTASELFAHHGYNRASLRQLTQKAGVNLAAVNYHFGDKKSLYKAVITRHIQPINQARLSKLHDAEQQAGDKPVALAIVLDILARPVFELSQDTTSGGHHIVRIIGRSMVEPLIIMDEGLATDLQPITARFAQAMRRHVPHLPPDEYLWRLSFVVGALYHTLATLHRMKELTRGICWNNDHEVTLRRFIQFSMVTLTAPDVSSL